MVLAGAAGAATALVRPPVYDPSRFVSNFLFTSTFLSSVWHVVRIYPSIVTIGPVGLLLLLGFTFYLGARPVRKGRIIDMSSRSNASSSVSSGTAGTIAAYDSGSSGSVRPQAGASDSARGTATAKRGTGGSRYAMAAAAAAERARQGRARPSARRVWRNGPGDESDVEQVGGGGGMS